MAYEKPLFLHSRRAAADLTTHQYKYVKLDANGDVILCAAATDVPYGILQNAPNTDQDAEVMLVGISKLVSGGVIAVGALVGTDANGKGDSKTAGTDTTEYTVGRYIGNAAAAANDIITVTVNTLSPGRAA